MVKPSGRNASWLVVAPLLLVSACTASERPMPTASAREPAPASSPPTAFSPTPSQAGFNRAELAAAATARSVLVSFLRLSDGAAQAGEVNQRELEGVSGDPALAEMLMFLDKNREAGIIQVGSTKLVKTDVQQVDLDTSPPRVRFTACLDVSARRLVFAKSGDAASSPSRYERVLMPVTVVQALPVGSKVATWLVVNASVGPDARPC